MANLPKIASLSDLRRSIKTTLGNIETVQERIHNEAMACIGEFFRPESSFNTNWIKEQLVAYFTKAGSFRLQSLVGWYEEYAGVTVEQAKDGSITSVKKNRKWKGIRDDDQLQKCQDFPFYKWGELNLEPPLRTPKYPDNTATVLAKMIKTDQCTEAEAMVWIDELKAKVLMKEKDDKVLDFADEYNAAYAKAQMERAAANGEAPAPKQPENVEAPPAAVEVAPAQAANA